MNLIEGGTTLKVIKETVAIVGSVGYLGGLLACLAFMGSKTATSPIPQGQVIVAPDDSVLTKNIIEEKSWETVEDLEFEINLEEMNPRLVKRTIDSSNKEVTLIEYKDGTSEYIVCSREKHRELVERFQKMLKEKGYAVF